jgi:hypothetical protein
MNDDRREFYEKELAPQLDTESLLLKNAGKAMSEGRLEDASFFVRSVLLINPNNERARKSLQELDKLGIRELAHKFIQKFYPGELNLFDIAWRVFKDIRPEVFKQDAVAGALGIVGKEPSKLNTPKVIILLSRLSSENIGTMPDKEIKEKLTDIGRSIGCSQELVDEIFEFIHKR